MRMMVLFSREGDTCFLGHLDIQRTMQRALRRSGLPVEYSQGFSPHMLITFASAMPVGLETEGDIMEVSVTEEAPDFREKLQAVMPAGFTIKGARRMDDSEGKTMATLAACRYRLFVPGFDLTEDAADFLDRESVVMPRKTKSGVKNDDIRPMVYSLEARPIEDGTLLLLTVRHDNQISLRPEIVVRALLGEREIDENTLRICRTGMYRIGENGALIEFFTRKPER